MKQKIESDGRVIGPWTLDQLKKGKIGAELNGLKVFSCFHCGGGSTMGYKLAGFEVLGGVEIDSKMSKIYVKNHSPKYEFLMGVQDFKNKPDKELPSELFGIDILDGSPPCSSFSIAGSREKDWGKKKKFREGQADQVLDDLFFDFIDIARKLKPKIVIAENVKGLVIGKARGYVKQIFQQFESSGYDCQLFLLNSSRMGVPQERVRTFFIARRKDLRIPKILLEYKEDVITFEQAIEGIDHVGKPVTDHILPYWKKTNPGKTLANAHEKGNFFTWTKLSKDRPANTQTSCPAQLCHDKPNHISAAASVRIQSFPDDYDFLDSAPRYVCGMSVPPYMMQRLALDVARLLGVNPKARKK